MEQEQKEISDLHNEIKEIKENLILKKNLETKIITPLHIDLTLPSAVPKMLIFGGTSTIGLGLIKRFYEKYKIFIYSRNNQKHYELQTKFPKLTFIVGDVRDYNSVYKNISFLFPSVIILNFSLYADDNPTEMIKTNIDGVSNIINSIINNPVYLHSSINKTVLYIGNPQNPYKTIGEKLIINAVDDISCLKFISLRISNIIESKDSIINKSHTVGRTLSKTAFILNSERSTLFLDKLDTYIDLIEEIILNGKNKHIYIPILKTYLYKNIINYFSNQYNKPISITGLSYNEKITEFLISETEALRTVKTDFLLNKENKTNYTILPIREKFKDSPLYNCNLDLLRITKPVCLELINGYNSSQNNSDVIELFKP